MVGESPRESPRRDKFTVENATDGLFLWGGYLLFLVKRVEEHEGPEKCFALDDSSRRE